MNQNHDENKEVHSKSLIYCTGIGHCPSTDHSYIKATHHEWNKSKEEKFPLWLPRTALCLWSGWRFSVAGPSRAPPTYFFYLHSSCVKYIPTLWKFVAENYTENFATLKITLKNNIKEGSTENYTEKRPLLFRNAKKRLTYHIFIQTKYHFKY